MRNPKNKAKATQSAKKAASTQAKLSPFQQVEICFQNLHGLVANKSSWAMFDKEIKKLVTAINNFVDELEGQMFLFNNSQLLKIDNFRYHFTYLIQEILKLDKSKSEDFLGTLKRANFDLRKRGEIYDLVTFLLMKHGGPIFWNEILAETRYEYKIYLLALGKYGSLEDLRNFTPIELEVFFRDKNHDRWEKKQVLSLNNFTNLTALLNGALLAGRFDFIETIISSLNQLGVDVASLSLEERTHGILHFREWVLSSDPNANFEISFLNATNSRINQTGFNVLSMLYIHYLNCSNRQIKIRDLFVKIRNNNTDQSVFTMQYILDNRHRFTDEQFQDLFTDLTDLFQRSGICIRVPFDLLFQISNFAPVGSVSINASLPNNWYEFVEYIFNQSGLFNAARFIRAIMWGGFDLIMPNNIERIGSLILDPNFRTAVIENQITSIDSDSAIAAALVHFEDLRINLLSLSHQHIKEITPRMAEQEGLIPMIRGKNPHLAGSPSLEFRIAYRAAKNLLAFEDPRIRDLGRRLAYHTIQLGKKDSNLIPLRLDEILSYPHDISMVIKESKEQIDYKDLLDLWKTLTKNMTDVIKDFTIKIIPHLAIDLIKSIPPILEIYLVNFEPETLMDKMKRLFEQVENVDYKVLAKFWDELVGYNAEKSIYGRVVKYLDLEVFLLSNLSYPLRDRYFEEADLKKPLSFDKLRRVCRVCFSSGGYYFRDRVSVDLRAKQTELSLLLFTHTELQAWKQSLEGVDSDNEKAIAKDFKVRVEMLHDLDRIIVSKEVLRMGCLPLIEALSSVIIQNKFTEEFVTLIKNLNLGVKTSPAFANLKFIELLAAKDFDNIISLIKNNLIDQNDYALYLLKAYNDGLLSDLEVVEVYSKTHRKGFGNVESAGALNAIGAIFKNIGNKIPDVNIAVQPAVNQPNAPQPVQIVGNKVYKSLRGFPFNLLEEMEETIPNSDRADLIIAFKSLIGFRFDIDHSAQKGFYHDKSETIWTFKEVVEKVELLIQAHYYRPSLGRDDFLTYLVDRSRTLTSFNDKLLAMCFGKISHFDIYEPKSLLGAFTAYIFCLIKKSHTLLNDFSTPQTLINKYHSTVYKLDSNSIGLYDILNPHPSEKARVTFEAVNEEVYLSALLNDRRPSSNLARLLHVLSKAKTLNGNNPLDAGAIFIGDIWKEIFSYMEDLPFRFAPSQESAVRVCDSYVESLQKKVAKVKELETLEPPAKRQKLN